MKKLILGKEYFPKADENKMANVGNVRAAREHFLKNRPSNLEFLLHKRFSWMNDFIAPGDVGIEVGGGGFEQRIHKAPLHSNRLCRQRVAR